MKADFHTVLNQSNRKVVIHHCHLIDNIVDLLKQNDLVFFDDCLYSQYVFIKDNIESLKQLNVNCVLGFSASLHRDSNNIGVYNVKSSVLHDKIHANDYTALDGFMSIDELNELLLYDNIYLACHGNMHLELQKSSYSNIDYVVQFTNDLSTAIKILNDFKLCTDIFVYPYAFDFFISDKILKNFGFKYVFAGKNSKRIEIERLVNEENIC